MTDTAPELNELVAERLNGEDNTYDSFALDFRTGAGPLSIQTAATGTLLLSVPLPDEWATFDGISLLELDDPIIEATIAAGEAGYWRLRSDGPGSPADLLQGDVSLNGEGGDLQFNDLDWGNDEDIALAALSIQLPATSHS